MSRCLLARTALTARGGGMVSRRLLIPLVTLLSLLLAMPTLAITYGTLDGNLHPNVGSLVDDTPADAFFYCTGTLIDPKVFLTAAHCVDGVDPEHHQVHVTFDSVYSVDPTLFTGTYTTDPDYSEQHTDHDIAVVVFEEAPLPGITPDQLGQLPKAGQFNTLKKEQKNQLFTAVGYGVEEPVNQPGGPVHADLSTRRYAVSSLNAVNPAWLRLSQNPAHGDGGTCSGDSGGPNFLGAGSTETHIIAGITITGDTQCKATNVVYRLDTESARSFLSDYVIVPTTSAVHKKMGGQDHSHKHRQGDHRHR